MCSNVIKLCLWIQKLLWRFKVKYGHSFGQRPKHLCDAGSSDCGDAAFRYSRKCHNDFQNEDMNFNMRVTSKSYTRI